MAINYAPKLTHTAQLRRGARATDGYSDVSTPTLTTTVACYCYYNTASRIDGAVYFSGVPGWTVILPKDTVVVMEDILYNIVDKTGRQILAQGRIIDDIAYDHYRDGRAFVQVQLKVN